ncbi:hypothetical protein [uncultured Desulfovibrio sp.]|uniref:hypothetical protein n=1 Tax=uncultured Desulfovibrio sp. TaxID=167968 RepID=UPI00260EDBAC|nr:hypothetical protein [uncultured Desulfovibrio sp.]
MQANQGVSPLKRENARRRHGAAWPDTCGKAALFPQNDRSYGLQRNAFQTENTLAEEQGALSYGEAVFFANHASRRARGGSAERGARKKASGMSLENNMPLTAEGVRRRGFFHKGFSDPDPGRDRKICGEGKCPGR